MSSPVDSNETDAKHSSSPSQQPTSSPPSMMPSGNNVQVSDIKMTSSSSSSSSSAAPSLSRQLSSMRKQSQMRLLADFQVLEEDEPEGCSASPVTMDDMYRWNACIFGPDDCEWEGGILQLTMKFPTEYPQKPPQVRFTSKMYHPNVYPDGSLCLDLLQDKWTPAYSVSTILTSIRSLLTDPNPASPANPEAAQLFANDLTAYKKRVRKCVLKTQEG